MAEKKAGPATSGTKAPKKAKKAGKKSVAMTATPSRAMISDLADVLMAHNWSRKLVRARIAPSGCPAGKTPVEVSYYSNGEWVTEIVCK